MPKKTAPYYWNRGGYYFRKWVPKRNRMVDPTQSVASCLHTTDELETVKRTEGLPAGAGRFTFGVQLQILKYDVVGDVA